MQTRRLSLIVTTMCRETSAIAAADESTGAMVVADGERQWVVEGHDEERVLPPQVRQAVEGTRQGVRAMEREREMLARRVTTQCTQLVQLKKRLASEEREAVSEAAEAESLRCSLNDTQQLLAVAEARWEESKRAEQVKDGKHGLVQHQALVPPRDACMRAALPQAAEQLESDVEVLRSELSHVHTLSGQLQQTLR
jgi:vacuolar-type H+-ATPase subunit D/Vma8|eukprot:COSAG01_NODE_1397_length_10467_cov_9.010706_3_plen_196_part_00